MTSGLKFQKYFGKTVTHLLSILICLFFIIPFFIMLSTSLKTMAECYIYPITWLPEIFQFENYTKVFEAIPFVQYFTNTLFITLCNILGVSLVCPLVAYSFSRLAWRGRDTLFFVTLGVMIIPYQVIMVPIFLIFKNLGLVGTFAPLIVPQFFGSPFFIFLLRQFFMGLPKDLEDAARIDGCHEFQIYYRIFLPLCRPAIITIMIFQLLNSWNDFTGPLIYLQKSAMYTLSIGLQQFKTAHMTLWPQLTAASTMMSFPIIVLFFFAQKQFMEGITFSGIKG